MFTDSFLDLLAPRRCASCQVSILHSHSTRPICDVCEKALRQRRIKVSSACDRCQELIMGEDPICQSCLLTPYPFRRLRSLFEYSDVAEKLIKSFKYDGRREICQGFVQIAHEALEPNHPRYSVERFRNPIFPRADWDLVIALPSSRSTLKTRGYSHMTLLTTKLGKMLRLPAPRNALTSRRARRAQVELSPDARWTNMRHAFDASESQIKNRTVLLIDDVITTGASLSAATLTLQQSGALVVDILTLARSKQFHRHRLHQL